MSKLKYQVEVRLYEDGKLLLVGYDSFNDLKIAPGAAEWNMAYQMEEYGYGEYPDIIDAPPRSSVKYRVHWLGSGGGKESEEAKVFDTYEEAVAARDARAQATYTVGREDQWFEIQVVN